MERNSRNDRKVMVLRHIEPREFGDYPTKPAKANNETVPNRGAKRKWGIRKTNKQGHRRRRALNVSIPPAEQPWHTTSH